MNKKIISLLLAIILICSNIYAKADQVEWQEYQISVSDANGAQTVAMPIENASSHAYWIKMSQEDSLEGLKLHISHPKHENYTYYPANGTELTGIVDANGTLDGNYLAVQVFNEHGEQIDTVLLYISKMPMPEIEPNIVPAEVEVLYNDNNGNIIARDVFVANSLGENTITANQYLIPKDYSLVDTNSKFVELKENGIVEPKQVVFLVEKQAVKLGTDILVEYVDQEGNTLVSEQVHINKLGENTIKANKGLIPDGYNIDGIDTVTINLDENNIADRDVVQFKVVKDMPKEVSATVSVVYVDTNGEYINSEQVTITKQGKNTIHSNNAMVPDGFVIDGADSYDVELSSDGTISVEQITFTYKLAKNNNSYIKPVTITIRYVDVDSKEDILAPTEKVLDAVGEHTINNVHPQIEGYESANSTSEIVTLFDDNTVDKQQVIFSYKKKANNDQSSNGIKPVKITVHYIDASTNKEIQSATEKILDSVGKFDIKPEYQNIDGFKLVGQGSQEVEIYDDGSASTTELYFAYQKNKPNVSNESTENDENKEQPSKSDKNINDITGKIGTINANSVNVRKKPSRNADQITQLSEGDKVTILEVIEHKKGKKWVKIQYANKRVGYMQLEFINISEDSTANNSTENSNDTNKVSALLKVKYLTEDNTLLYEYESTYNTAGEHTVDIRNVQETEGYAVVGESSQKINIDKNGNIDKNPLIFIFKKVNIDATVKVHYVDSLNKPIADDSIKHYNSVGDFILEPEKNIAGYELVEPKTYSIYVNDAGVATPDDVIFKYEKKNIVGTVNVDYIDQDGNKIVDTSKITVDKIGVNTITPSVIITGYDLVGSTSYDVELKEDGTVEPQNIEFYYQKHEVSINAQLTIHYVDENAQPIAESTTQTLTSAGTHDIYPNASIPSDYELVGDIKQTVKLDENNILSPNEITFRYKKNEKPIVIDAKLKVRYVDTDNNPIAHDDIVTYTEIGEHTVTPKLELNDYLLQNKSVKVQVNADSTVTPSEVLFIYERILPKEPKADVHIMYVNQNGTPIARNTVQTIDRLGNNTVVARPESIPEGYELIGNGQKNVVLYADGTADPNPVIFEYKNIKDDFEHYKGFALSNSKVALRTSPSSNDNVIIKNLDRNTLLYIAGQQKNNGILYHSVQLLNGDSGFIMDSDITKISDSEAEKYKQEYLNSIKPNNTPQANAQIGYAMTLGNIPFRQFASGYSNILQELYSGTVVFLNGKVEYNEDKAWYVAQYNGKLGYVRSDQVRMLSQSEVSNFLKNNSAVQPIETQAPQYNPNGLSSYGYVTSGDVNFRSATTKQSRAIGKIKRYGMGLILETSNVGGTTWYKINFDGKIGYVQGDYFKPMTLDEFSKFIKSDEYRQGIRNNSEIDTGTSTKPIRKPKYDAGYAKPGKPQTIEDYNAGTWRNPNLARASYEPFRPNLTPMPEVEQVEISPTPTMIVDPNFSIAVVEGSPSVSPSPSESMEPLNTEPIKETTEGSSPFVFIGLIALLGLGGVVAYAAIMKNKRMRLLQAQKQKHDMAQRQALNRQNANSMPRNVHTNQGNYTRNNMEVRTGANQFRPVSQDAFKKPNEGMEPKQQSVEGNNNSMNNLSDNQGNSSPRRRR